MNPTLERPSNPQFTHEQIEAILFDSEGNEYLATITYWYCELQREVKEVKCSADWSAAIYTDIEFDVREAIYKRHSRRLEIIGEIEII